ncbi:putative glycosyl transferase, family 31 [Helianthus annuus]|uniref:Glycosyl transferase, family 31 n=1 Tax=Helianthus annuus TaxID=4232 RepID=A0A9K3DSZ0_HELAN|nr:putative glycosyl transferase, family 31 [Helianthus annuus]
MTPLVGLEFGTFCWIDVVFGEVLAFFKAAYALYDSEFYVKADDDIYLRPGADVEDRLFVHLQHLFQPQGGYRLFQWSLSLKQRSAMCLGNVSIGFNALLNAQRSESSLTNTGREGGT